MNTDSVTSAPAMKLASISPTTVMNGSMALRRMCVRMIAPSRRPLDRAVRT